jgi:hypothetical protein
MDILNKMTVPELKSVLREHKKVHYQPYSKLKREELVKLITYYKLHETTDLTKHIKVKVKKVRTKSLGSRVKINRGPKDFMQKILNNEVTYDVEPPAKRKTRRKKNKS